MTSTDHDSGADGLTPAMRAAIRAALAEDVGAGDATSAAVVPPACRAAAEIIAKQDGVIAGLAVAAAVFAACDPAVRFEALAADGARVAAPAVVARVEGSAHALLAAERTALNFLQRMSGIATLTRRFVDAVAGTRATILDTRKTAPLLRPFDRAAVRAGGGTNHRRGLDDMLLVKENHIAAAGGVTEAIAAAHAWSRARAVPLPIEVEVRTIDELRRALAAGGLARVMLDNFPLDRIAESVALVGGRVPLEFSGGVTLASVRRIAETGVEFISVGALTHSAPALDLSMVFAGR